MNFSSLIQLQRKNALVVLGLSVFLATTTFTLCAAPSNTTPLDRLLDVLPEGPEDSSPERALSVKRLVPKVEQWAAELTSYSPDISNDGILELAGRLIAIRNRVDRSLARMLEMRLQFLNSPDDPTAQDALKSFLTSAAALTDLSGRLRYLSVDVLTDAGYDLENDIGAYEKLVDLLIQEGSTVGAIASLSTLLERGRIDSLPPLPDRLKGKIVQLTRVARNMESLPWLARLIRSEQLSPEFTIFVADTIRYIGLPQEPRPGRDPTLQTPAITAQQLYGIVAAVKTADLSPNDLRRQKELLDWLKQRRTSGATGPDYRMGNTSIQAGDWLLMKNPSPYNRFTDLQPGLFTHAGIVTDEVSSDGRRRFVVVDLPETEHSIPATTVDTFVKRTLNYVFVRHKDPQVAQRMAQVARTVIGNESKFDLNFETKGIEQLKGQNLEGKTIDGYCAGLLLLCAQETGRPRREFFPVSEHPASGKTLLNLAQLDVSMQRDFLSPTGAFFSPQMTIVHRSPPMYSPRREIEQGVYDHFATQMQEQQLTPSLDWHQTLRLKMAEAARGNQLLAGVLANAAGVNRNMNLVAAAKLGAVVQTLDEFAYGASGHYRQVRDAFQLDAVDILRDGKDSKEQINDVLNRRRQHADLFVRWEAGVITSRELRIELVDYYIAEGCRNLDDRFFTENSNNRSDSAFSPPAENP